MTTILDQPVIAVARLGSLALVAALIATGVGFAYRWYARSRAPAGLPVLAGLSGVAVYLNTTPILESVIVNQGDFLSVSVALYNVGTLGAATVFALGGARLGDYLASESFAVGEADVSRLVQAVGRAVTVELPAADDIDDMEGYDPVEPETMTALGGHTFTFPRKLTVDELRARLVERLETDYAVGHVDVDLDDEGAVEYLALGRRVAGLGPTLLPGTVAVPVRADPANAASPGDSVQVFHGTPPERVVTGEVRGTAGDVVTLAVDAAEADRLNAETRYRLATMPAESRPDREFTTALRAAEETLGVVDVSEGSPLVGKSLEDTAATVLAVTPAGGSVEAIPTRDRAVAAGDRLYVVARPEVVRRLQGGPAPESS